MSTTLRERAEHYRAQAGGELAARLRRTLIGVALDAERMAKENATTDPRVRTGNLRRSIVATTDASDSALRIDLSAGEGSGTDRYASSIEYGATIRPRGGRFLAIPTGPALTGAGVPRYPSARAAPGLRFVAIRGGSMGLLVRDVGGRNARGDIWYFLVRQTTIRPRRFIGRAIDEIRPVAVERFGETVRAALGGG